MLIVPYEPEVHASEVEKMLISRLMPSYLVQDLPEYGLIAMEGDIPVAAGFIRRIEGPYVMLDSYISNSEMDADVRDKALNRITAKLLKWARSDSKVTSVIAFSADPHTQERAHAHGFFTFSNHIFQIYPII